MRKLEPHPLIAHLEPAATDASALIKVLRVEKRELKGSSIWAGPYLAFVIGPPPPPIHGFPCGDHTDVGWAIGALTWLWFDAHEIPRSDKFTARALFSVEDLALNQELKCWFRVEMARGQAFAHPIVEGLDATSPGDYKSINDYLMTQPQYRNDAPLELRLSSILIPENRCPDSTRELTLRGDKGQELRYRTDATGKVEVTGRTADPSDGATLDEIIAAAEEKRKREQAGS